MSTVAAALLATPEQRQLYWENAWFRGGIDQLALMLPYFVGGLAADAERKNEAMQRDIDAISRGLPR